MPFKSFCLLIPNMSSSKIIIEYNNLKIEQYWKKFIKSGQSYTLAICYSNMLRGDITDEIAYYKKTMYCLNKDEKKRLQTNAVNIFWYTEVDYICKNASDIREISAYPLSHLKLFKWMKKHDCDKYIEFKTYLNRMLYLRNNDALNGFSMSINTFVAKLLIRFLNDNLIL